jgi:hypothetical protein
MKNIDLESRQED